MGFYLKKSVRVGPLRFNFSKSGVGVSGGVKGFRIGSGPRGNYVHMGRGGLYYRKNLLSGDSKTRRPVGQEVRPSNTEQGGETWHEPLQEIESGDVQAMVDSSSAELVEELNAKRKKVALWPFALGVAIMGLFMLNGANAPGWTFYLFAVVAGAGIVWLYYRDQLAKTVVMFYEIDSDIEPLYQTLHDSFDKMVGCSAKWHVEAKAKVKDKKRSAGADNVIRRSAISLKKSQPPYVKTNIEVPSIPVGKQTLYLFPDKMLIFEPRGVGAVSYPNLHIDVRQSNFIEDEKVPKDSQVVGHTWKYVNKKGGPDKRFKDNRQIPVVLYEYIHFISDTGLNEQIKISRTGIASNLKSAISTLGQIAGNPG